MEEVKQVLALFDSADKWNAFIEISNMREKLINELKDRLVIELKKITGNSLADSGWDFYADYSVIEIKPIYTSNIDIRIEWNSWNSSNMPWCRRAVCVWVDARSINSTNVFNLIKSEKERLPLQDYEENIQNHSWLPFIKQIPSKIFNVDDNITSVEECLYMAKDDAAQLAKNLWENIFKPFANKETAYLLSSFVR